MLPLAVNRVREGLLHLQKEYPWKRPCRLRCKKDVRREESICECILDLIVDHSELTVHRWTVEKELAANEI